LAGPVFITVGVFGERYLIQSIVRMDRNDVIGVEASEDVGNGTGDLFAESSDELPSDTGRIAQRAENVKEGAGAEDFADRHHETHGRMEVGRKNERDAGFFQAVFNALLLQLNVYTQCFQHVR